MDTGRPATAGVAPGAVTPAGARVLRARRFRSVSLEREPDGGEVVVKRFHHPNPLRAALDGRRARHEHAALVACAAAGLRVPRPRGVHATPHGWEVRLDPVPQAHGLDEILAGSQAPPGGWNRLARALGRLLADLHATRWKHGDLHPGNVLVDAHGEPWLIDFQRARRQARRSPRREQADIVRAAAIARECLPPRVRARFLLAWLRAAWPSCTRRERGTLLLDIEQRARIERRAMVRTGVGRWLRESSRVRLTTAHGRRVVLRRDLPDEAVKVPGEESTLLIRRGLVPALRSMWLEAAALHEHRIPVARPAYLVGESRRGAADGWAAFEPPTHGAPTEAALHALLLDRGLRQTPTSASSPNGHYYLP